MQVYLLGMYTSLYKNYKFQMIIIIFLMQGFKNLKFLLSRFITSLVHKF